MPWTPACAGATDRRRSESFVSLAPLAIPRICILIASPAKQSRSQNAGIKRRICTASGTLLTNDSRRLSIRHPRESGGPGQVLAQPALDALRFVPLAGLAARSGARSRPPAAPRRRRPAGHRRLCRIALDQAALRRLMAAIGGRRLSLRARHRPPVDRKMAAARLAALAPLRPPYLITQPAMVDSQVPTPFPRPFVYSRIAGDSLELMVRPNT